MINYHHKESYNESLKIAFSNGNFADFWEKSATNEENMRLWSVTTTVRNPERIRSFLSVLKELEGNIWNNDSQRHYQILLLQRKVVGIGSPEFEKDLSPKYLKWLHSENFTYEQAEEISNAKNYVGGLEMRGQQSFNPLEKMGFAFLDTKKKIKITTFGKTFLSENYDLGEIFFRSFLKWQYPNPDLNKYSAKDGYNIKPPIASFHLIKKVNSLCVEKGIKEKGVSKTEFKGEVSPSLHTRLTACITLPPLRGFHPRNAPTLVFYKTFFDRKVS